MDIKKEFLLPNQTLKPTGVSMLIYGPAGGGKTSLIKNLLGWTYDKGWGSAEPICKPEEIFVISVDAGTSVLHKENKLCCTIFPITDMDAKSYSTVFDDIIEYLLTAKHPFKYIFWDNVSETEKYFVLRGAKHKGLALPRQKEWGDASIYVRKYLREFINLTFQGMNVIFNFWDMIVKIEDIAGSVQSIICPMCMSKTWKEYTGLVEHYAYLGISPKDSSRFMQFETHGMIQAKTRCEAIGVRDDGTHKPGKFEKADLAEVLKKITPKNYGKDD